MAGVLKLNSKSLPKKLNHFTFRYFSSVNKTSHTAPMFFYKKFSSYSQHKLGYFSLKHELVFKDMILFQNRGFKTSLILCEDKIVVTPPFPESVAEGDLKWEKGVGDSVNVDEIVCEIETDKTSIPVPSPGAGVIAERFAEDGATVKAGQQLFRITLGAVGAVSPSKPFPKPETPVPSRDIVPPPPAPSRDIVPPPPAPSRDIVPPRAAPIIAPAPIPIPTTAEAPPPPKKPIPIAPKKQVQLIEGATVRLPPEDPAKEITGTRTEFRVKMNRMRKKIAERLKEAQNTSAMLTTFNEIDMSAIIDFRKTQQDAFTKKFGVKFGFMSPFIKAAAYALQDQPVVNAVIMDNEIVYRDYIDISIAIASPKGLVVPVIRNVADMNYGDIEKALYNLGEKVRTGKLAVEDMDGGTFTISNGGVFGSLLSTPIINPPQSAILGMHATFERPVAVKGQILIRPMMYVALSYDHRLIDGREAVLFLRKIKIVVEDPKIIVAGL